MLKIGYLVICEDIIIENNQISIRRPFSALTPLNLPGNFSFKVAFSLHNLTKENFGEENTLKIEIKDSNDKTVVDTGNLNLQTNPRNKPETSRVEIAEADMTFNNIELYSEGIYTLTLYVNEENKELKIPVIVRKHIDG